MARGFNNDKVIVSMVDRPDPVIVEVGSHLGTDTCRFLKLFPEVRLFCFEPDPRNVKAFRKYMFDPRLVLYPVAVSDRDASDVRFYQAHNPENWRKPSKKVPWIPVKEFRKRKLSRSSASSLKTGHSALDGCLKTKVDTIRLDTWFHGQNIDRVDVLWVDVQGSERDVLVGASDVLKITRFIWIEYGELGYVGSMTRKQTIRLLSSRFNPVLGKSSSGAKGNLLFRSIDE